MKKHLLLGLPLIGLALLAVSCGNNDNPTTTTVVNTTTGGNTTSAVSISEDSLARINVNADAMKKVYYVGEKLDLTGLVVTAIYENGESKVVTDYTYDEKTYDSTQKGVCFVKIIYTEKGITKTRSVQVDVKSILDDRVYLIGISCSGVKSEYKYNEQLDTSNLVVKAFYSDNSSKELNAGEYELDTKAYNPKMRGNYEIVVKYKEVYTQSGTTATAVKEAETCFFANVILNMTSIEFAGGTSMFYQYGGISTSNWKIKVNYAEGVSEVITAGFETDIATVFPDSNEAGSKKVNISYTYNGKTCTTTRNCLVRATKQIALFGALATKNDIQNEDYKIDDTFTLLKGYKVIENRQECDDQIFSKCITLDGVGSRQENAIKLNVSNASKIQVCVSSEEGTKFGLYDSEGNAISTGVAPSNVTRYTYSLPSDGTYYLWSEGGLNVYYVATFE